MIPSGLGQRTRGGISDVRTIHPSDRSVGPGRIIRHSGNRRGIPSGSQHLPGQQIAAVVHDGRKRLVAFRWGLIPAWADDPAIGNRMFNARAETLAEKPSFKQAFKKRRCLIPVDGFYEWQKMGKGKQPLCFSLKSGRPFGLAGLYETWVSPDEGPHPYLHDHHDRCQRTDPPRSRQDAGHPSEGQGSGVARPAQRQPRRAVVAPETLPGGRDGALRGRQGRVQNFSRFFPIAGIRGKAKSHGDQKRPEGRRTFDGECPIPPSG